MKQLLKFFILLLLCMVLRNLQSVLPKQLTQIDLIFSGNVMKLKNLRNDIFYETKDIGLIWD